MDRIKIVGGGQLNGTIPISGAKNAALPLMIASLLTSDRVTLKNVPNLADVNLLARILRNHGTDLAVDGKRSSPNMQGETFHLTARDIVDTTAPYEMVSRMRASFWVLGPILSAHAASEGFASRRLRDRHAARRPAFDGAQSARRRNRDRWRLCARQGSEGAARRAHHLSKGVGGGHA